MRQLFVAALISTLQPVLGQEFQCTLEKYDAGEHCVFRDVRLGNNSSDVKFTYPADVAKPSQVAFVDSNMEQLPSEFLTLAGPELKVLRVENCGLKSITISSGLEELYAKNNSIEEVIVHQSGSGPLRMLDLSGNKMSDFSNVTECQALEVLNLSGNGLEDLLDLGKFRGLNKLHQLDLSHNDINYLDNTGNVNLESLEDLDLSYNNILPSDLKISIFYPYTKLHTLRLNDNFLAQLYYEYLLNIKFLRTVYLNGNNFQCRYLDRMLRYLQQNNLQTPPGELACCPDQTLNDFCCTGPLPTMPTSRSGKLVSIVDATEPPSSSTAKPTQPTPIVSATESQKMASTEQPIAPLPVEEKVVEEGGSALIWVWIVSVLFVCIVLVFIYLVFIVFRVVTRNYQQKKGIYQVPEEC